MFLPFLGITLQLTQLSTPGSLGRAPKEPRRLAALRVTNEGLLLRLNSPTPALVYIVSRGITVGKKILSRDSIYILTSLVLFYVFVALFLFLQ